MNKKPQRGRPVVAGLTETQKRCLTVLCILMEKNRGLPPTVQELADELGLRLQVCHFPPGTSKWNKIEHRLFSFITQNWRG
ncbi:MAG TPA: hypothetical protein PKA06_03945, partial [Gemmatales bacterium]|nr:hypothetical protein [Gemmatales bacterium]